MTTANFEISVGPVGRGSVKVNGEDVSDQVSGVAMVSEVGQATVVTLRHAGGTAEIAGEGIVRVVEEGDAVVRFLEDIDAKELERATLGRLRGLGGATPIAEALEQLKEWARGA